MSTPAISPPGALTTYLTTGSWRYFDTLLVVSSLKRVLDLTSLSLPPQGSVCGTHSTNMCEISSLIQEQNQFIFKRRTLKEASVEYYCSKCVSPIPEGELYTPAILILGWVMWLVLANDTWVEIPCPASKQKPQDPPHGSTMLSFPSHLWLLIPCHPESLREENMEQHLMQPMVNL